jgi:hypothetical protein
MAHHPTGRNSRRVVDEILNVQLGAATPVNIAVVAGAWAVTGVPDAMQRVWDDAPR